MDCVIDDMYVCMDWDTCRWVRVLELVCGFVFRQLFSSHPFVALNLTGPAGGVQCTLERTRALGPGCQLSRACRGHLVCRQKKGGGGWPVEGGLWHERLE